MTDIQPSHSTHTGSCPQIDLFTVIEGLRDMPPREREEYAAMIGERVCSLASMVADSFTAEQIEPVIRGVYMGEGAIVALQALTTQVQKLSGSFDI